MEDAQGSLYRIVNYLEGHIHSQILLKVQNLKLKDVGLKIDENARETSI